MKVKILLVLSIAVTLAFLFFLTRKENSVKTYTSYRLSSIQGFHLTHKEGSKIKWELIAKNVLFPEGDRNVLLKDLTVRIHHNPDLILTGEDGDYNVKEKNLLISKPVEIRVRDFRLTTDSLTWYGESEVIKAPNEVRFVGKNFSIEGKELTASVREKKIRILRNVKGIFYQ